MNKLNEKVIADEFSPWEESFNDLFKTMELSKRKKAIQEATRTLQPSPRSLKKENSKSLMSRTLLSMSKINLHGSAGQPQIPIQEEVRQFESKRYSGPRVTFYAKMNPRGSHKSRSTLKGQEQYQSYLVKRQLKGVLAGESSIKYLQIIEEKDCIEEKKSQGLAIPKPLNLHRTKMQGIGKNDDQHMYLRRLKMIYNTRKQ